MPSIDRSTYVTPIQRGALPGGYDVQSTGHGTRSIIEFDNISGLQRRIGTRPEYEDLTHQGCQPTGRRSGPPGYESEEYNCPFPIVGQPAWAQPGRTRSTVFEGFGASVKGRRRSSAIDPNLAARHADTVLSTRSASNTKSTAPSEKRKKAEGYLSLLTSRLEGVRTTISSGRSPSGLAVVNLKNTAALLGKNLSYLKAEDQVSAKALVLEVQSLVAEIEAGVPFEAEPVVEESFFQRNKVNLIIGGVGVAVLGAALYFVFK